MYDKTLLRTLFLSALALVWAGRFAMGADPNVPTSVENADRQFLTNLEKTDDAQRTVEAREPERTQLKPAPAPTPVRSRELTSKPVAAVKKPEPRPVDPAPVKVEDVQKKPELVEVRRAIPVETTTATVSTTARIDQDHDHDRARAEDRDDDGFFHRLFHGQKIFR